MGRVGKVLLVVLVGALSLGVVLALRAYLYSGQRFVREPRAAIILEKDINALNSKGWGWAVVEMNMQGSEDEDSPHPAALRPGPRANVFQYVHLDKDSYEDAWLTRDKSSNTFLLQLPLTLYARLRSLSEDEAKRAFFALWATHSGITAIGTPQIPDGFWFRVGTTQATLTIPLRSDPATGVPDPPCYLTFQVD